MDRNLTEKLIAAHLVSGDRVKGSEISITIDQTLTQDALGTMAYLEFEAMGVERVKTKLSVSYVDHLMLQEGFENSDDHKYLRRLQTGSGCFFQSPAMVSATRYTWSA
jgi:aconitate hydratase